MIHFLAVFAVLFVAAAGFVAILPTPPKVVAASSAVATQLRTAADPAPDRPAVRVVYPASVATAPAAAPAAPVQLAGSSPEVVPATPAVVAATAPAYPQTDTAVAAGAVTPADASAQAGTRNVNINTASIDALNGIPGAGHIGRMIASHRPYGSVEDLLRKRVVRKSVYDRIKDQVAAD